MFKHLFESLLSFDFILLYESTGVLDCYVTMFFIGELYQWVANNLV